MSDKSRAYRLYQTRTIEQLQELSEKVRADPVNKAEIKPGQCPWIYTKKARAYLDDISWAITWKLADKRKEEARVNSSSIEA